MNRTIFITLATLAASFTPAAAAPNGAAVVPNASQNGTLITVPICKELSQWPNTTPAGFNITQMDGSACQGWNCYYSYALFSQGNVPRTISWDQDATLYNVIDETCACGVFETCAASQEPRTVSILPSPSSPLLQITGEIFNITDAAVQAHVEYRAFKSGPGIADAPMTLVIQVFNGYAWSDVASRALPYDQSFWGNLYHSADLSASVPANTQIRAEVRWAVPRATGVFLPPYTFNLKAASLFGAQCFPSPDPNSVMCQ